MKKNNSDNIFNLLGLSADLFKDFDNSIKEFDLHKFVNDNNEHFAGKFNSLSEDEQTRFVNTMNAVQKQFDEIFGTKSTDWTVDDFKGADVNFNSNCNYDSKKQCDCNESCECKHENCNCNREKKDYVKPEVKKIDSVDNELSEKIKKIADYFNTEREKFGGIFNETRTKMPSKDELLDNIDSAYENILNLAKNFRKNLDDLFGDDEVSDADNKKPCECAHGSENVCPNCGQSPCVCDEPAEDAEPSICSELLKEVQSSRTHDEDIAQSVVDYVVAVLMDKDNKKYKIHPGDKKNKIPAAVEVEVPESVVTSDIFDSMIIPTLIVEGIKKATQVAEVYPNHGGNDKNVTIYMALEKVN